MITKTVESYFAEILIPSGEKMIIKIKAKNEVSAKEILEKKYKYLELLGISTNKVSSSGGTMYNSSTSSYRGSRSSKRFLGSN